MSNSFGEITIEDYCGQSYQTFYDTNGRETKSVILNDYTYEEEDRGSMRPQFRIYEYDIDGQLIKETDYSLRDSMLRRMEVNQYDNYGNKVSTEVYDSTGT